MLKIAIVHNNEVFLAKFKSFLELNASSNVIKPLITNETNCPQFIILETSAEKLFQQLVENNASCVEISNPKYDDIIDNIKNQMYENDVELLTTNLIRQAGVPAHMAGYKYLRTAILECVADSTYLDGVTKKLYPCIAKIYNTKPTNVERAIRHAIKTAWNRNDKVSINKLFGCNTENYTSYPTNSEFIAVVSENISILTKRAKHSDST
ncbi:MAG: sporulation initiation factor Spo0A C-terminal domain-containing protein [Ruminococcus sp.]|nr:sporulation initiation factor Spo0A C-terminal domain-containing protein [Ruminococcus sp.]